MRTLPLRGMVPSLHVRVPLRPEFGGIEEMCDCNAGGEVVSGQELVIESIDVD